MKKPRKHYTGEEKVAVLRRHLLEREAISKLCDELGLQPTVFLTVGRRNSSRTGPPPSRLKAAPISRPRRNASSFWRRRSSAKTRFWLS